MKRSATRAILSGTALAALFSGGAAWADVKAGVEAWSRGDYAAAVHEWQGPAAVGDADAMFNLGQAYRLGRGVPQDPAKAEELYARAAAKGHLQAADTYGLMLFQDGRHEAALPYLQDAVRRGDPRAEYLLGIAAFNGDAVPKDWVRAYALLTLANRHDLPQAAAALAQMDQYIPLEQRQRAASLALQLESQANAARGRALAAADLGVGTAAPAPPTVMAAAPVSRPVPTAPPATVAVSPSVAAAREALAQARQATGTESPAKAGARFARRSTRAAPAEPATPAAPAKAPEKVAAAPARPAAPPKAPQKVAAAAPEPAALPATPAEGPWRVQLGAFAVHSNADKLWAALNGRSELSGRKMVKVPVGAVVKLQAAGYPSRVAAEDACQSLKHAGHDCLVTR